MISQTVPPMYLLQFQYTLLRNQSWLENVFDMRLKCSFCDFSNLYDGLIVLSPFNGGDKGGEIVVVGTSETVAEHPTSHTGRYLKQVLEQHPPEVLAG